MKQNYIFVAVLFFVGGCGSLEKVQKLSGLNEDKEVADQLTAIKNNDVDSLKTSLGNDDLSSKSYLIDKAIEAAKDSEDPKCPDKMFEYLLAKGAIPTESGIEASLYTAFLNKNSSQNKYKNIYRERNLSQVMEMGCPSTAKSFAEKMDNGEIEKALDNFLDVKQFRNTLENGKNSCYSGNTFKGQVSSLVEVYSVLSKKCPDCSYVQKAKPQIAMIPEVSKRSADCLAADEKELKDQELRKKRETEVDVYMDSPLGKTCENLASISAIRKAIAKEEEVGRRSGYIRKDVIYQGHKNIMYLEEKLAENKKEYRRSVGRDFGSADCKGHQRKSEY